MKKILSILLILCTSTIYGYNQKTPLPETATLVTAEKFKTIPTVSLSAYDYLMQKKKDGITRFIFVRHGESTANIERSVAGRTLDVNLTALGEAQAIETGKKLAATKIVIDTAYSSPMLRARKTTSLILDQFPNKKCRTIAQDVQLHEIWLGQYEGASDADYAPMRKKIAQEVARIPHFKQRFTYIAESDMESMKEVYDRVMAFLVHIQGWHAGETILVGTHNGVLKALFMADAAFKGYDVPFGVFVVDNSGIVVVEVNKQKEIEVVATEGLSFARLKNL